MGNPDPGSVCDRERRRRMKYRNRKTGVIVDVKSEVAGLNWEKIGEDVKPTSPKPKKSKEKSNG